MLSCSRNALSLHFFLFLVFLFHLNSFRFFAFIFRIQQESTVLFDQIFIALFLDRLTIKIHIESLRMNKKKLEKQRDRSTAQQQQQKYKTYKTVCMSVVWCALIAATTATDKKRGLSRQTNAIAASDCMHAHTLSRAGTWLTRLNGMQSAYKKCSHIRNAQKTNTHSLQMLKFYAIELVIYHVFFTFWLNTTGEFQQFFQEFQLFLLFYLATWWVRKTIIKSKNG